MQVSITNTSNQVVSVYYRVSLNGEVSPLQQVDIQPRALCNTLIFTSEAHFEAFKDSAKDLFESGVLLEGKTSGTKAEKMHDERAKSEVKAKDSKAKNATEKIKASVDKNTKADLKVEVDSL